jgi:hypothetical protein
MAQVIVRNLEEAVKRKLQRRAARHGRSMEEESSRDPAQRRERRRPSRTWSRHGDRGEVQKYRAQGAPELRGYFVKPAKFDE